MFNPSKSKRQKIEKGEKYNQVGKDKPSYQIIGE